MLKVHLLHPLYTFYVLMKIDIKLCAAEDVARAAQFIQISEDDTKDLYAANTI